MRLISSSFPDFDELVPSVWGGSSSRSVPAVPPIDMYDDGESIVVEMPLAGYRSEDVSVFVENSLLVIEGSHNHSHEIDEKDYYRQEVRRGSFRRQIPLPLPVGETNVSAELVSGILKITCPKAKDEPRKKIPVKISGK